MEKFLSLALAIFLGCFVFLAPAQGKVWVEHLNLQANNPEYFMFSQRFQSWFAGDWNKLGGEDQEYILFVAQEKNLTVYLDGQIEPLWEMPAANLKNHPQAVVFSATLWADDAALKVYSSLWKLEKIRRQEVK